MRFIGRAVFQAAWLGAPGTGGFLCGLRFQTARSDLPLLAGVGRGLLMGHPKRQALWPRLFPLSDFPLPCPVTCLSTVGKFIVSQVETAMTGGPASIADFNRFSLLGTW